MLLSAVSILVVAQSSSEIPERLTNNPVLSGVCLLAHRDKWVPVTTTSLVIGLWMEERSAIWRVAANILNKHSQTADKG